MKPKEKIENWEKNLKNILDSFWWEKYVLEISKGQEKKAIELRNQEMKRIFEEIRHLFKLERDQLLERIKLKKITTFTKEEEEQMRGFEPTLQQQHRIDINLFSQGYNQAIADLEKIKEEIKKELND